MNAVISRRMVGKKYISLNLVDDEYELSVYSVKGEQVSKWPRISVELFTDERQAQEAYEWKVRTLSDRYSF